MEQKKYVSFLKILEEELVPALGCTEPIAIAFAAAKARTILEEIPEHMDIFCSGNIIKNVRSVIVPNSEGMHGIEAAAILGMVGGNSNEQLQVLKYVTDADRKKTRELLNKSFCTCHLQEGVSGLYICVKMKGLEHCSEVVISKYHTNIICIKRDGKIILNKYGSNNTDKEETDKRSLLNVEDILSFANEVKIQDIEYVIGRQIQMNTAIAEEGIANHYGAEVGRTLLSAYGNNIKNRARAKAAAGSDARMNGCALPVIINSGSGNQGITCSVPVIEFARELKVSKETLYRALVVSNLIAIHQKYYIGCLSAYCGAVSAACGAGAAITYLYGGNYEAVSKTIINTIANVGGIVCDGAKSSCAAKIASAVDAAIMAHTLEMEEHCFRPGEGLVRGNVEETIMDMGYVGKVGMKETDTTILRLMLGEGVM